ncbi:MAG: carbamoyl transferase [Rhodospirillaceae bacterium]|nr:MAG: carbamoyl transferase [Rhodospirillaceae bacterium]
MTNKNASLEPMVLGLGGSGHEWASCVSNGNLLTAIAEERTTRKKYGLGADLLAAESRAACLKSIDATVGDLDKIVACDLVPRPFYFSLRKNTDIINHHLAHAYSAFATSGLEKAAILIVDNSGSVLGGSKTGTEREVETISMYDAGPDGIKLIDKISGTHYLNAKTESDYFQAGQTSNSLGHFYRSASLSLGFSFSDPNGHGVFSEDGKTMGLSPYGDDRFVDDLGGLINLTKTGVECDARRIDLLMSTMSKNTCFEHRAALAYATQYHLERAILHLARRLYDLTKHENLCIAGGVGLNSVANGKLVDESPFKHIYVPPAPSDDGISIGCTAYGLWEHTGSKPVFSRSAYLGPQWKDADNLSAIEDMGVAWVRPDDLIKTVSEKLCRGHVVAWWQGRSEFGPRALGNRSILALPRPGFVRDKLNHEMKKREWFRPYAPMVPEERKDEYFDFSNDSPHMSFVAKVKKPDDLPAATHVDGTARLQTIRQSENPRMHALLEAVGEETGTPILLNTSFNLAGEPIVESSADAIRSAKSLSIVYLVLGNYLVTL